MDEIVLKATDLCKHYGSFKALDHLSLTIEKGKTYGLIGQNGAGKTTFIRQVCGLSYPSGGELALFGKSDEKGMREGRKRMGCLVETPAVNLHAEHKTVKRREKKGRNVERLNISGFRV